ncbi:MAG: anti-sigma factor [Gemmataceae bacterium]
MPRADELAAYVDDRLAPADRQRVEDWLQAHPGAADELRAHEKLQALYQRSSVSEPPERDWNGMAAKIHQGVIDYRERPPLRRWPWAVGAVVAAASLVFALSLGTNAPPEEQPQPVAVEPWPVVDENDVEIISVDVADARALVIGEVPTPGPIVLMEPGDVILNHVEKDANADFGQLRWRPDQADAPMIWAPLVASDSFPNDSED